MQDYFEYIIQKHDTLTNSPPIQIYFYRIDKRITSKAKTGYIPDFFIPKTMKLLENKNNINKDKNGENAPHLEIHISCFNPL